MLTVRRIPLALVPVVLAALGLACGGDESLTTEDHTPVSYDVLIDGAPATAPYTLVAGQTVHVQIKFFNRAGEDLDEVETTHFAGLTFDPVTLAEAVRQADHHYQFDVTGGTVGAGTVEIGFGHDDAADEVSFDPVPVTVTSSDGGGGIQP